MNGIVQKTADLLRRTLGERYEIETMVGREIWSALADPTQVESALVNLCINARDAMPDGGSITIETANIHLDAAYASENPDVNPGDYVMLAVTDTGIGISSEHLRRVFEPFFTTKEVGKGTGLGLSMVYGFAKQSQGHVKIYSEVGHGTTVRFYLPRATVGADLPIESEAAETSPVSSDGKVILVVDDNEAVRKTVVAQLNDMGYQTCEADNARNALQMLERDLRIALVFTDVVMPGGMTGVDLASAVEKLRPDTPILFTSGFTEASTQKSHPFAADRPFLSKPYRKADLGRKVREVLGQA